MQIIDLSLLFILYSFALANIRIKIEISLTVNKQEQPTKIMRIPNGTFANDYHLKLVPFDKFKFFYLSCFSSPFFSLPLNLKTSFLNLEKKYSNIF